MEFLIQRNVPQRTAHEVIGRLVSLCESRRVKRLADLTDAELAEAHPQLGPEVRNLLGVQNAIKAFRSYGSTAPTEVEKQLERWMQRLADIR
jgi:argininosuccinate lyase